MKYLIAILLLSSNLAFGQTLLMEREVEVQIFGKEVFHKDSDGKLLEGHYKIASILGNYSDVHFKKGKKHGKETDYDSSDRVEKTATYKNGRTEGTYTMFHQNGKVSRKGEFVAGEEEGEWRYFNRDGELMATENYKNGKKHGKWWKKMYRSGGQETTFVTEKYENGQHVGHAEEKGEDGKLKWEREYVDSQNYSNKEYFSNGKIKKENYIKSYKIDGKELIYNQLGVLLTERVFNEGQLGKATFFYENSNKESVHNYKHGKRDGLYQEYTDTGIKIEEGNFKDNYKNGVWKAYDDESGSLLSKTYYEAGVKHGSIIKYNEANKVSVEGTYKNGEKHGIWKHYNLSGQLTEEVEYELGREISRKEYK